jgi:hypothetical protein
VLLMDVLVSQMVGFTRVAKRLCCTEEGLCSIELVPVTISTNEVFNSRLLFKETIVSMCGVSFTSNRLTFTIYRIV